MSRPVFRSIVDQRTYRLAAGDGHHAYLWRNIDPLLGVYPGAIGIKTGYTAAAGHCLLFEATRNGCSLIGVTLDSPGVGTTVNGSRPHPPPELGLQPPSPAQGFAAGTCVMA